MKSKWMWAAIVGTLLTSCGAVVPPGNASPTQEPKATLNVVTDDLWTPFEISLKVPVLIEPTGSIGGWPPDLCVGC